jgi:hypothetical protein
MTDPQHSSLESEPLNVVELVALAAQAKKRIQCLQLGDRKVWIKKAVKQLHPGHYLQMVMSLGLPGSIYRPSPPEVGAAASHGEAQRIRQFEASGMDVPELLYEGTGMLVLGDCGPTVEARLRGFRKAGDAAAHDELLVAMARSMGAAHAAGLVHGRPHPRDMFVRQGRVGFMDFEQNPLRAMSLVRAQARDALFLFGFVCDLAMEPETPGRAWDIWASQAPVEARMQLGRTLKGMKPLMAAGRLASRFKLGSDLRRFLAGAGFLSSIHIRSEEQPGAAARTMRARHASPTGKANGNDHRSR